MRRRILRFKVRNGVARHRAQQLTPSCGEVTNCLTRAPDSQRSRSVRACFDVTRDMCGRESVARLSRLFHGGDAM